MREQNWGLYRSAKDYEETKQILGASLYEYLSKYYTNPYCPDLEQWKPDRYDGQDKETILNELT